MGNNEAVAAASPSHGMPISVVADDSAFPELFEHLRRAARGVGRDAHPVAQPARDLRRPAARRAARPARRLGLPQRRDPGPPVRRLDDAAGRARRRSPRRPASRILPIRSTAAPTTRSTSPSTSRSSVASTDPAELQRATQAIADALAAAIAAAPDQWYSFKPMWPATAEEARRPRAARARDAGRPSRIPGPARPTGGRRDDRGRRGAAASALVRGGRVTRPRPARCSRRSWLACRLPEGPLSASRTSPATLWYRLRPGPRGAGAAQPAPRLPVARRARPRLGRGPGRGHATRRRSSASSAPRSATTPATTSRSPGRPAIRPRRHRGAAHHRDARRRRRGVRARARPVLFVGLHFGSLELPVALPRARGSATPSRRWRRSTTGPPGVVRPDARRGRDPDRRPARGAPRAADALRDGVPVGLVGDRDLTGGGSPIPLFGAPAMLPLGPAMLAVESGAPAYVDRRPARRRRRVPRRLEPIRRPGRGHAPRARDDDDDARWPPPSSDLIADAPEQWWAVFFPIWPDLEAGGRRRRAAGGGRGVTDPERSGGDCRARRLRGDDGRAAGPTCTSTPSPATARPASRRSSTTSSARPTSTSSPSPTTSGSTRRVAAQAMARRPRPARRGRRRRGDHDARRPPPRRSTSTGRSGRTARCATSILAVHDAGGLAIPAHPLVPVPAVRPGLGAPPAARRPRPGRPP